MSPDSGAQYPRFTLSILTENETSALVRLTMAIARHRIGIESLTTTCDASRGMSRHTLLVRSVPDRVRRAMKQIGGSVGVLAAAWYPEGDTVDREVALYKLAAGSDANDAGATLKELVRVHRARVLVRGEDYIIVEKTGCGEEIQDLYERLEPYGVVEFVRSGRVMVTKSRPEGLAGARTLSRNRVNGG